MGTLRGELGRWNARSSTTTHEQFRASFRRFVAKEIVPHYLEWEAAGIVAAELFAAAGATASSGWRSPRSTAAAASSDFRYNVVIVRGARPRRHRRRRPRPHPPQRHLTPYFLTYCIAEQRQRWLPGIASGELITAIAMTEPGIGSDLASMSTTAIRDGDDYIVNGSKTFITNGINADLVITAVKTDPTQKHKGMSLFVLERGMEGFERGRNLDKIGLHTQDTAELFFTDVHVPGRQPARRGGPGLHLPRAQPAPGAAVDRGHRRGQRPPALGWTLDYVKERQAFGQPIGSFQNIEVRAGRDRAPRWRSARPSSTAASSP